MHEHHHHSHGHAHFSPNRRKVFASILLNGIITIAEIIGGILSNSLALLSDAIHNLSDTLAILFSYIALKIGEKEANDKKTFGYKRAEILAAFINSSVLIVICAYLLYEAWERFRNPQPIQALLMLVIASIGFVANFLSILLLRKDSEHNLNLRAAYLHLLGDTLSSVGVIIGAIAIYFWQWTWLDPVLTVVISLVIIRHTWTVLTETIEILMQAAPTEIQVEKIREEIEKLIPINNIHHVHLWRLTDSQIFFECHIDLQNDLRLSESDKIRQEVKKMLTEKFSIYHSTIQIEYNCCPDKGLIARQ
jgi:cobalt-zinc-cadmium efflux system protein